MTIINVKNLKNNYGTFEAVKNISFYVEEGSLFSFLGENGAGKSTTIMTLATLLKKNSGQITIAGHDIDTAPHKIKKSIGMVFQDHYMDDFMAVNENLYTRGRLYGLSKSYIGDRINALANTLEATDILGQKYKTLSGGQKRKTDIMRALLHNPKILILDEPTTGLDPYTRKMVWDTLLKLKKETNLTIFLTTHYMEEAKKSDYMVILDHGIIKAKGQPEDLRLKYSQDHLLINPLDAKPLKQILETIKKPYKEVDHMIRIPLSHPMDAIDILNHIRCHMNYFEVIRGTMDDVFINIIKEDKHYDLDIS